MPWKEASPRDQRTQFMAEYQSREGQGGMGLALLAIVATTTLLAILTLATRKRGQAQPISRF